ncbi:MAG: hypothetical protein OES69_11655, partial [Myxococcales bacterium]|nr:hypothetical protein [Myxococcales bacterium]
MSWEERPIPRVVADVVPGLEPGRNVLQVDQGEGYAARCAECALTSTGPFLESAGLNVKDIDLVVPSPTPAGFADTFSQALGV